MDASGCKHKTVEIVIGCCAILPKPRRHSANRPATASVPWSLDGRSWSLLHSPIVASTILGHCEHQTRHSEPLLCCHTYITHLPIFAHDPAAAVPAGLTSTSLQRNSKSLFVPSSSAPDVECCAVLCCGACSSSTSTAALLVSLYSGTQPPDSPYPTSTNTVSSLLSARFNTSSPRVAAFSHASSQHPFFSADQSRKSSHSTTAAVHASLPHFRLPTHIITCSGR